MKKDCIYFVQDAFGYLCNVDDSVFSTTVDIWKQNSCDFEIIVEDKGNYITKKLFRQ